MFNDFFELMRDVLPEDGRVVACQFRGDPNSDIYGKWKAIVLNSTSQIDDLSNVYLCVSAMKRNARGEFRRRKENFAGGILLMIDDVGTGPGAKFPLSTLDALAPTALIETSPDNYQAMYFFDRLVEDMETFDALIRAFIQRKFLGTDTGQAGVNRVFRPPAGINGKPKYYDENGAPWTVKLHNFHPERRYSVQEIATAFGLSLVRRRAIPKDAGRQAASRADRIRHFVQTRATLRAAGWIKREEPDYSGWIHVRCPWTHQHTGGVDNGAAIRLPEVENDWYGAFRCHHGHCGGKGWRDLTDWLSSDLEEALEATNEDADDFRNYDFTTQNEEET